MIIETPSWDDFRDSGVVFMDLGWTYAVDQLVALTYIDSENWCSNYDLEKIKASAERHLSVSLALVQQGIELILKGRIAEVSPFLLIKNQPRQWPSRSTERDVSFSEFRTIDAQDLVRVYESINKEPLADGFKQTYERLRRHRNLAFHTAGFNPEVESKEVLMAVLEAADNLLGHATWLPTHRELLERSPYHAFDDLGIRIRMMQEMELVEDTLDESEMTRFVGYNADEASYTCPSCRYAARKGGGRATYAQASARDGQGHTSLYCFCCCTAVEAHFFRCQSPHCRGTYLDDDGECLLCGNSHEL